MSLRVPTSLHALEVERHHARDPASGALVADDEMAGLATAMGAARQQAEQVAALAAALAGDRTRTPEAAALEVRRAALLAGQRGAAALDRARQRAADALGRLDLETAAPPPPRDPIALQLEGEVRAKLDRLPEAQRRAAIEAGLASGDDVIVGAVLRGPALLSGLGALEHDHVRQRFRHARHPAKAARMERLAKAIEAADLGGRLLLSFVEAAASGPAARRAEAQAGAVDAALQRIQAAE